MKKNVTKPLLGVNISVTPQQSLLDSVQLLLQKKQAPNKKFFIVTPNPEIVVEAQRDPYLLTILNSADISLPDGEGISRSLNIPVIKGRSFMIEVFKILNENSLSFVALVGSVATAKKARARLAEEFPNIRAEFLVGPKLDKQVKPVSKRDTKLQKETLRYIKKFSPEMLFIAFGAPKQEKWIYEHIAQLPVRGAMVVGGALDYYAGVKKMPPELFSKFGIEWLWRLLNEEGHISRVYTAVVIFTILVIKGKLHKEHQ